MSIMIHLEGVEHDDDGVPVEPWVNLANGNAVPVFGMLGIRMESEEDLYGSLEVAQLPEVIRRCIQVMNSANARASGLRDPVDDKPSGRCRYVQMGLDDKYFMDRAKRVLKVLQMAQKKRVRVVWG